MLVSAGTELKFSNWPADEKQECYNNSIGAPILCASWSKNNAFIVMLEKNGQPEILSMKDATNVKPIHIITAIDGVTCVLFSRNRNKIVAIGTQTAVALYDTSTKTICKTYAVPEPVVALDFNWHDSHLAAACRGGHVELINLVEEKQAAHVALDAQPTAVRFHPCLENVFGVTTGNGRFLLCDASVAGAPLWEVLVSATRRRVNDFAFYPLRDRAELVTVDNEYKVATFDSDTGKPLFHCSLPHAPTAVDYSSDGCYYAVGTSDGCVCVFQVSRPATPLQKLKLHPERVYCVRYVNPGPVHIVPQPSTSTCMSSQLSCTDTSRGSFYVKVRTIERLTPSEPECSIYRRIATGDTKSSSTPEYISVVEDDILDDIKKEIIEDVQSSAAVLSRRLSGQISAIHEFVLRELQKAEADMTAKWNMLDLLHNQHLLREALRPMCRYRQSEEPIIIE